MEKGNCSETFAKIKKRFHAIVEELGLDMDIEAILRETEREIDRRKSVDFTASRGEYLNARIVAAALGVPFIDAQDVVFFDRKGRFDEKRSYPLISRALTKAGRAVVPGFYGTDAEGISRLFPAAAAISAVPSSRRR